MPSQPTTVFPRFALPSSPALDDHGAGAGFQLPSVQGAGIAIRPLESRRPSSRNPTAPDQAPDFTANSEMFRNSLDKRVEIYETIRSTKAPMTNHHPISLTKLESEVMTAVWGLAGPVRVREVAEAVNAGREPPLAYTTIQSVLTILKTKEVVEQVEGVGRAHAFKAKVSREQASHRMVRDLADRLFGGRVEPLLLQLIGEAKLKPQELSELRQWVDSQLRDAQEEAP